MKKLSAFEAFAQTQISYTEAEEKAKLEAGSPKVARYPIGEDGEDTLMDMVPSEAPAIESIIADRDLLDRLFARLRELDPDADTIITMWMDDDNVSDRAIAKALGRPQRTFADQMKKYRTELRRIRGY